MGRTEKQTGKWGLRLFRAMDIALCLVIAYLHGMDEGVDSGAFKERFKASFKVAPVLVVNWLYVVTWTRDYDTCDLANSEVWIFTLEQSTSFFLF